GWVRQRPLRRITKERLRDGDAAFLVGFPPLGLRGLALSLICAFQLVIPRRLAEQLLNVGRRVVRRGSVNADNAVIAVETILRPQFEAIDAVSVYAYEVQTIGRHLQ